MSKEAKRSCASQNWSRKLCIIGQNPHFVRFYQLFSEGANLKLLIFAPDLLQTFLNYPARSDRMPNFIKGHSEKSYGVYNSICQPKWKTLLSCTSSFDLARSSSGALIGTDMLRSNGHLSDCQKVTAKLLIMIFTPAGTAMS